MQNFLLLCLLVSLLVGVGCGQDEGVPVEKVIVVGTETAVFTPTPTQTPMPSTATPQPTSTLILIQTAIIEATIPPTAVPINADEDIPANMQNKEYEMVFSTSGVGPESLIYSVYAFRDASLKPEFGGEANSEICRLVFYRWNETQNELIADFGAAAYPENSRYGGFPVNCSLANWDNNSWFTDIWGPGWSLDEIRDTLNLDGYWSDVNQNGLPEVGVFYWYCPNACYGYEGSVHLYEIQDADTVAHISADFKGILLPWKMLHSKNSATLLLFDPSLEYEPHNYIETWWIYAWDGAQYTDVTTDYAEDYLSGLNQYLLRIREQYGSAITYTPTHFLEILFESEKYGVQDEGIEVFLEVTNPENWPGTEQVYVCWLQVIREQALQQYNEKIPFTMPPTPLGVSAADGFDMQTCQFTNP